MTGNFIVFAQGLGLEIKEIPITSNISIRDVKHHESEQGKKEVLSLISFF